MAKTVMPIAEKNPFLTGTHLAPATALSHQLGLKVELQDETENYDDDDDDLSGEGSECSDRVTQGNLGIDQSVREDMAKLEDTFEELGLRFRLIDRIGEGTFSTVYKAEDLHYEYFQNEWDIEPDGHPQWTSPSFDRRKDSRPQSSKIGNSQSPRRQRRTHYVAIKKIYVTSSPMRIQNELELLHDLRGCKAVCPLITAFRHEDQVVAVLPHFEHQDFRLFYRHMNVYDIKVYFRSLFEALAAVHKHGIIHRDIKPTNFLYDYKRQRGVLVDFGLAEREGSDCSHCLCLDSPTDRKAKIQSVRAHIQPTPTGYPKNDQRPSRRANRAGTRGFRAPEVLLKCTAQTTKIDVWSAGVILLTILAQRFPFFNSADDVQAMIEIATVFGRNKMKTCAVLHGATFECTIPTVGEKGFPLSQIVSWSISESRDYRRSMDPEFRDTIKFLESCLDLDPKKRLSAKEALAHPFLIEETYSDTEADEMDVL